MVVFLALLHSLLQYPKDYLHDGITHCTGSRRGFNPAITSGSPFLINSRTIANIMNTINNRIKGYCGILSEDNQLQVTKAFADVTTPEFWENGIKNVQVHLNGFNTATQTSFYVVFLFTNKGCDNCIFKFQVFTAATSSVDGGKDSILSLQRFEIVDDAVSTHVELIVPKALTQKQIDAIAQPIVAIVTGYGWTADLSFFKTIITYLKKNVESSLEMLPYIKETKAEVEEKVATYLTKGLIDLKPINDEIIRICSITPTPVPEPEEPKDPKKKKKLIFWENDQEVEESEEVILMPKKPYFPRERPMPVLPDPKPYLRRRRIHGKH